MKVIGCNKPCPWILHEQLSFQGVRLSLGGSRCSQPCVGGTGWKLKRLWALFFPPFLFLPSPLPLGENEDEGPAGWIGLWVVLVGTGAVVAALPGRDRVRLTSHLSQCSALCPVTPGWMSSDWGSGLMQCHACFSPFPLTVTSMNCTGFSIRPNPKTSHLGNHLIYCTGGLPWSGKP